MNANRNNTTNGKLMLVATLTVALAICASANARPPKTAERTHAISKLVESLSARHALAGGAHQGHGHAHDDDDAAGAEGSSTCIDLNGMSVMFDPGATVEDVVADLEAQPDDQILAAFLPQGSRWTFTATDGAVSQGQRLTLTYSFVPDGTPLTVSGYGQGNSNLFAAFDANFPGGRAAWKAKFAQAFARFGELTNIDYVEVSDDGAAFPSSLGLLGTRGDIRIAMMPLGVPLAVNFYPQFGGDMVLDSQDMAQFTNASNDFRALRNVLMHEHGHGLGLKHVLPQSGTKLMEPVLNVGFDGPQEDDTRAVQFLYGDWAEPNAGYGEEAFVGGPLNTPVPNSPTILKVEDVSLERAGESDWYGFTAFAGVPITIRVEPIGTTYEFGEQDSNTTTTVNARAVRNLGLRLYRRVSAQTGQLTMLAQIDFNAAGEAEYHPPVPYNQAGYMLAEVYSTDGVNDVQRYELTISNAAIEAPVQDPSMSVYNVAAGQQIFDGTTLQFGQVNVGASSNVTLTITNGGPGTLEISQPSLAGPAAGDYAFSLIGNPVAAGGSASLLIGFNPSAAGVRQAVLTVPNNDPTQPNFSLILSGSAVQPAAPLIAVKVNNAAAAHNSQVNLGQVELGSSITADVEVRNNGNANLNVSAVNFFGGQLAEFSVNPTQANIAPNAAALFTVTATPTADGTRTTKLRIFSNAQPSPYFLDLSVDAIPQQQQITDCNTNGVEDAQDIADGTSTDCNSNGIPDECETDSDGDGVIDDCDLCPGQDDRLDSDGDNVPDCLDTDPFNPDVGGEAPPPDADTGVQNVGICGIGAGMPMMLGLLGLCGMGAGRRRSR